MHPQDLAVEANVGGLTAADKVNALYFRAVKTLLEPEEFIGQVF